MFISKLIKKLTLTAASSLVSLIFLAPGEASAASLVNGGFAGSFNGWQTIGDASIQSFESVGIDPTEGDFQALLSTTSRTDDNFNLSGVDAADVSDLEIFLGLKSGSLDSLRNGGLFPVEEGTAIKQTFTAEAGSTLNFDFNFLTDEFANSADFNTFAFFTLNNTANKLADTFSNLISSTFFDQETGYGTFSTVLSETGTYTLAFGVVDVGESYATAVSIDNVRIVPSNVVKVPEPSSVLGIFECGVLVVGFGLLKRQQTKSSKAVNL